MDSHTVTIYQSSFEEAVKEYNFRYSGIGYTWRPGRHPSTAQTATPTKAPRKRKRG